MARAEPGLAALIAGLEASGRWALANRAVAELLFWRPVPSFQPSEEAFAPSVEMVELEREALADAVAAGHWVPEANGEDAIYLVSTLIVGVLSQAFANEPDLPWGEGRFTPRSPGSCVCCLLRFRCPSRRHSCTSPAAGRRRRELAWELAIRCLARPRRVVPPRPAPPFGYGRFRHGGGVRATTQDRWTDRFLGDRRDVAGPDRRRRAHGRVRRHARAGGAGLPDVPGGQCLEHARRQIAGQRASAAWLASMDAATHQPPSRLRALGRPYAIPTACPTRWSPRHSHGQRLVPVRRRE